MRKYYLITIAITSIIFNAFADDIIVIKDGSIINAKVREVTPSEVKYLKASRPEGPIYTLPKSEILAINYEDGEKEIFSETDSESNSNVISEHNRNIISESSKEMNKKLINDLNIDCLTFAGKTKESKEAKAAIALYFTSDSSSFVNDYVTIIATHPKINLNNFKTKNTCLFKDLSISVWIHNKSDQTIYVDKGTSFVTYNGMSDALFTLQ